MSSAFERLQKIAEEKRLKEIAEKPRLELVEKTVVSQNLCWLKEKSESHLK